MPITTQVKPVDFSSGSFQEKVEQEKTPDSSRWKTFATNTTLHGLRNVVENRRGIIYRVIWSICLCMSTGYYAFLVYNCICKYLSLPIQVVISQEMPKTGVMDFPAVTICNLNKLMKSKIDMAEDDWRFRKMGLNITGCNETRVARGNLTCGQAILCAAPYVGLYLVDGCNNVIRQNIIKALNNTLVNEEEFYTKYGHDFNSLMSPRHCRFGKQMLCSDKDFTPIITKDGICFTFNSGYNNSKLFDSAFEGTDVGLSVILDVQTNESTLREFSSGLEVVVHDQKVFVNRQNGFKIIPGTHASVALKSTKYIRLPPPYRTNCRQTYLPGIDSYTKDACMYQCLGNTTLEHCDCRLGGFPGPKSVRVCSFVQDTECVRRSQEKVNWRLCNCFAACSELEYETHISYSDFPDHAAITVMQNLYGIKENASYMKQNYVFLQVGFQRLSYEIREVVPSYGPESLFGEVGGNMGLFLGCSLLTICEFFDFILEAAMSRMRKRSTGPERTSTQ